MAPKHLGEKSRDKGLWKCISLHWPPVSRTPKSGLWLQTEKLKLQEAILGIASADGEDRTSQPSSLTCFTAYASCLQRNHTKKPRNMAENRWAWALGPQVTEKSFAFYYINHKIGTKRAWLGLQTSLFSLWCYGTTICHRFPRWSSKTDPLLESTSK